MHQVSSASADVSSPEFDCMVMIFKAIICIVALVIFKNKLCISHINAKKIKSILPIVIFASVFDGISYMLQLIGAESLPASVLYPFITGGSIILTSFAGVAFLKRKTHNSSMDGCYGVLCRNIIISIGEKRYEKKCI